MKKILLLIFSLFGVICFSQSIQVSTNSYSVPDLVKNVLVNKNCIPVNNITWRTGNTNGFGSSNGIGYFENTNPNFPLERGVVLSTGNVLNAPGPNTSMLNDGNDSWVGDVDLEKTLLSAGITMKSTNATVLEFDFVPFSSNFDFQFIFASEEYGNFQCKFSDAFAFLLTNKATGVTTNLAVIPGTNTPISVVTIRDFLYNSSCPSANSNYFGSFNGGSLADTAAINFNGQTVVMNASSTSLIPNTAYHIKLVIADRKDFESDSAIFLGANSFNVGQDVLGPDLTVANKTALCINSSYTLSSGLDPNLYTFNWTFDAAPIGGNTPNLTINNPGKYGLTYAIKSSGCTVTTDYIIVENYEPIKTLDPKILYKCNSGQSNYTFDLSYNTTIVSTPETELSYHLSNNDALNNSNPLPAIYTINSTTLPVTIWIRIKNITTNCVITKSFQLRTSPPPIAHFPGNMDLCESTPDSGIAIFKFLNQTNAILGGQSASIYRVSYYYNINDANSNKNPVLITNFSTKNITLFARVQNLTDPDCYSVTSFNLNVVPLPKVETIANQYVCSSYTLPVPMNPGAYYTGPNKGLPKLNPGDIISEDSDVYLYSETANPPYCSTEKSFKIKIVRPIDLNPTDVVACDKYVLPSNPFKMLYFTLPGGPKGGGIELQAGITAITNPGLNIVHTYFISDDLDPCVIEGQLNITIDETPKITDSFTNIFECSSYDLPQLSVGNYYTYNNSTDRYTLASSPITTTTTLHVFGQNNSCRSPISVFTVYIGSLGFIDINQCRAYDLVKSPFGEYRDAPNGGGNVIEPGIIKRSITLYVYLQSNNTPGCKVNESFNITVNAPYLTVPDDAVSCETFLLPSHVDDGEYYTLSGGESTIGNVKLIPNSSVITETTTIYISKKSLIVADCFNEIPWLITINHQPKIDSRANILQCDDYVLTPLENGNYYSEPNGVGLIPSGTIITERNKIIYIYNANPNDASCFSENSFEITVNGAKADAIPSQLTHCQSFTFPDLPSPKNYYYDAPGGPNGIGKIIPFGTTITKSTAAPMYYIYYETGDRLNCSDEKPFKITIADKPVANPVNTIIECDTFGENDGFYQFDLTNSSIRSQVLKNQAPDSEFTLTFYKSITDANNINAVPINNPEKYQNAQPNSDRIWVRIANNTIPNPCFDVIEINLKVNNLPKIILDKEYFICEDFATAAILNPATINTGLSTTNYSFEWTLDGKVFGGNSAVITTSKYGIYTVKITDLLTRCSNIFETKIIKYNPKIEIIYSDAFEEPSFITINVTGNGSGNYEYQLDNSQFQDSNVFNNVIAGYHTISVRDKNRHCNPKSITTLIINYPKYFTPNGDGYNETWNIKHLLSTNPNAKITIYDRYGKLITTITPSTQGWNGLLNGQTLPSTDYWFTVDFVEKEVQKTFKSHFSLKR